MDLASPVVSGTSVYANGLIVYASKSVTFWHTEFYVAKGLCANETLAFVLKVWMNRLTTAALNQYCLLGQLNTNQSWYNWLRHAPLPADTNDYGRMTDALHCSRQRVKSESYAIAQSPTCKLRCSISSVHWISQTLHVTEPYNHSSTSVCRICIWQQRPALHVLTLRRLMSYIYIWSTHSWCF